MLDLLVQDSQEALTVLCHSVRQLILCLVLIQPRKTGKCPNIIEKFVDWDVKHQHKRTDKFFMNFNCLQTFFQYYISLKNSFRNTI